MTSKVLHLALMISDTQDGHSNYVALIYFPKYDLW